MEICEVCRKEYDNTGVILNLGGNSFHFCSTECFAKAKKNKNIVDRISKSMSKQFPGMEASYEAE